MRRPFATHRSDRGIMHIQKNSILHTDLTQLPRRHIGSIAFAPTINAMAKTRQQIKDKITEAVADLNAEVRKLAIERLRAWHSRVSGWPKSPKAPIVLPDFLPQILANMTEYGQMPGNPEYKSEATSQHKTSHHYKDALVTALLIVVYEMTVQCFGPTTQALNLEHQHSQVPIIIDSFLSAAFQGSLCETVPGSGVIPMTLLSKINSSALGLLRDSYKNNTAVYKAAIMGGNMKSGWHPHVIRSLWGHNLCQGDGNGRLQLPHRGW